MEPSEAVITDMTGDGASDLLLLVHDRVIVYPQMAPQEPRAAAPDKPNASETPPLPAKNPTTPSPSGPTGPE